MLGLTFFPTCFYANQPIHLLHSQRGRSRAQRKDTKSAEEYFQKHCHSSCLPTMKRPWFCFRCTTSRWWKTTGPGTELLHAGEKIAHQRKIDQEQIDQVEKAINSRGNINVARSMGKQGMQMMRMGGANAADPNALIHPHFKKSYPWQEKERTKTNFIPHQRRQAQQPARPRSVYSQIQTRRGGGPVGLQQVVAHHGHPLCRRAAALCLKAFLMPASFSTGWKSRRSTSSKASVLPSPSNKKVSTSMRDPP